MEGTEMDERHYLSQWEEGLERSLARLEPCDATQAREVADAQHIRDFLEQLRRTQVSQPVKHSASIILPSINHFEAFNGLFVRSCEARLKTSEVWGLLYVTIKLAAELPQAMMRVAEMIKKLGQKIELLNECSRGGSRPAHLKETALDVNLELVRFFAESIRFFRKESSNAVSNWETGSEHDQDDQSWDRLMKSYNQTQLNIDILYQHIDQLTQLVKRNAQSEAFHDQQRLLSLSDESAQRANSTCYMLPPKKDGRFYNRDAITDRIEAYFNYTGVNADSDFRSLVLYGIGGVGKSHVALKYAHCQIKKKSLDVVLWIHSETDMTLSQSFTDAALALGLPNASRERGQENKLLVLNWLQRADCPWLLVYDNAVDPDDIGPFWPQACKAGSVLVTSRNHNLMFGPADDGIEIPPFFNESGTKFLLHLLRMDVIQDLSTSEVQSAHELAQQVDGHAQAISVMAGLIQRRSWGIQEFLSIYEKNREYIHVKGRDNALSTIWKLSFESLTRECATLLGILAYISPDSIPQELFTTADPDSLPQRLRCCHDELDFHETVEPLLTQALVQRDKEEKTYAVHRLVQIQYRYHLTQQGRQEAFNQAVKLLFEGFGSGAGQLYDRWTHCQMYIQQIVSLKNNYKKEMSGADRLHPTLQFCSLLARSSRYLVEIADYVELEDLLSVALGALEELPRSETKQRINDLATIVGATGLLWGHRGFFGRAIPFVRRANKLQSEREDKNWNSLSWSEVNLGNVLASAGEYDEALEWELKAEETRKRGDKNDVIKSNSVVQQNIGRCYTFLDQFDKAASRLQSAASEFKDSKNWAMLAFTLFVQGTLERRQGNLEASKEAYTEAQQVWILGGKLKTHHFNGACMYKLGCISMDLGDKDKAMEHLRAALVVAKLKEEVMAGDYARVLHKLSVLLNTLVGSEVESAEMAAKALRIQREMTRDNSINFKEEGRGARSALATEMGDLGLDDSDEKRYDELVYILWR